MKNKKMNYLNYINQILGYWFRDDIKKFWFNKNSFRIDSEITKKFKFILIEAEKGNTVEWLMNKDSYLAHIILMDQFSRHIYRNTPDAYKNDNKALFFMEMGLDFHLDKFSAEEKMFVLMPYQHTTNLECQEIGIKILKKLIKDEKNSKEKNILKKALFHQIGHYRVIKKFNRFPKRNLILERIPTPEEVDYMDASENVPY